MKSVHIKELGIHPWDQLHANTDAKFTTITLLNQNFADVWKLWCELSTLLTREWPTIIQWSTLMTPFSSKTQEYLALREFSRHSTHGDIFKKNRITLIYSEVMQLNPNPANIDATTLTAYRTSIVIMQKQPSNLESIWHKFSHLKSVSTIKNFELMLTDDDSIYFRFYDMETHGAVQLIGHSENVQLADSMLKAMNIKQIKQDDVYSYIHQR
ncbi:hypothetical protein [Pseudomonas sp. Leaf59]|uniref:hypothetical protein n=1 Tax=Pseudomonas sp. Leaf59 TaxID=2876556 RepID=UPI001E2F8F26|nr:hypothetical protein [Pseudomonas sp. Leaf59]